MKMRSSWSYSISRRLTLMNMLVSGVALLLACVTFFAYDRVSLKETMVNNLSIEAQIIASNSISALVFNDAEAAESTLAALKASSNITAAAIYTAKGSEFAKYSGQDPRAAASIDASPYRACASRPAIPEGKARAYSFAGDQLTLARRVIFEGKPVGIVCIQSDLKALDARVKRFVSMGAVILAVSLLAALLISGRLKRSVSEPIIQLASVALAVSREKNYAVRAAPAGKSGELATLIGAFNEMLEQIQERDVALQTARDQLELRVQERTAQLAAANKELEAFSYSVSHDLRAPLRHIDGFSMILMQKYGPTLDATAQQYLKRVRDGAKHMGHLVDDLLNMARIGRQELVVRPSSLNQMVQGTIADLKSECEGRQIDWQIANLPDMKCDPGLMKVVFTNLLSNAVKYTRRTEHAVIEVGRLSENGSTIIFIRDNGAGFEQEYAHKLFGVFQRLHRAEEFEGTGVGLATVQRIIQKHGGRIWAEGKVNQGATFLFTVVPLEVKA
ncbi:MAG TPA: ATP-binding protein [Terriglobia bacterium]|jgi:signal transduction histidine kinase